MFKTAYEYRYMSIHVIKTVNITVCIHRNVATAITHLYVTHDSIITYIGGNINNYAEMCKNMSKF